MFLRSSDLRREHGGFTVDHHASLAKFQRESLSSAGGRDGSLCVGARRISGRWRKVENAHAVFRSFERLTGKTPHDIDLLFFVTTFSDWMTAKQFVLAR